MKNFRHFLVVLSLVYLYGVVVTSLVNEGVIWFALAEGLKKNLSYSAAVQYAENNGKGSSGAVIVLGDIPFIELVRTSVPQSVVLVECKIPEVDLKDIVACMEGLTYVDIDYPVVANIQPYFFSNVVTKGNQPRFDILRKCDNNSLWSLCSLRRALKIVKAWSKGTEKEPTGERARLNELVSFDSQEKLMERVERTGLSNVYWIEESRFVDYSTVPELVRIYEQEKQFLLPIGSFTTLDELKNILIKES